MGKPRRKLSESPAVKVASGIRKKYLSPGKLSRARRALLAIEHEKVSIKKAAEKFDLSYGYLYRRWSGEVDVDKRKGPSPVLSKAEEESMAKWLKEMSERGMGLKPYEFMDFVQEFVKKDKRKTPFKDGRPGYDWYYAFLKRNENIVELRNETPLESCRAKLIKEQTDRWYNKFRDFLMSKDLLNSPSRIYNADETGFSLGSVAGRVIGSSRIHGSSQIPHVTGKSKQRITVMFCGAANGAMLPPFIIYPDPKPRGYNPLTGAIEGSEIVYTKKGWMDAPTFEKFINHFDIHAVTDRPIVLLIDSVSSHVSLSVFEKAKQKGIELYRLVPNATHLMQPLDKGVFGPLKQRWHQTVRQHNRANPGLPIGIHNFSEKLKDAFLLFYKPLTVINAFKASGIYPVDGSVITLATLKPGITYALAGSEPELTIIPDEKTKKTSDKKDSGALLAFQAFDSALSTPVREKYQRRLDEGYDIEGQSPCFDVYKKLARKTQISTEEPKTKMTSPLLDISDSDQDRPSGLNLLAEAALTHSVESTQTGLSNISNTARPTISPILKECLVYPKDASTQQKRKSQLNTLPDNLTSPESLRIMSLKDTEQIKKFSEREKKAKKKFLLHKQKAIQGTCKRIGSSKSRKKLRTKAPTQSTQKLVCENTDDDDDNAQCMDCKVYWNMEQAVGCGRIWVQCDECKGWIHSDCSTVEVPDEEDEPYFCHNCIKKMKQMKT